jgi:hypothetical protein
MTPSAEPQTSNELAMAQRVLGALKVEPSAVPF